MLPVKKTPAEIETYLKEGPKFGRILLRLQETIKHFPNINGSLLEQQFITLCKEEWGEEVQFPFKDQFSYADIPFNGAICISINDCACHGNCIGALPTNSIIAVDAGVAIPINPQKSLHFDAAFTVYNTQDATLNWIYEPLHALKAIVEANPQSTNDITRLIELYAADADLEIVVAVTGHGIGYDLHEGPAIYNATTANQPNVDLFDGICICIEPIYVKPLSGNQVSRIARTYLDSDTWSIKTVTGSPATHFETMLCRINGQLTDVVGMTAMDW